MACSDWEFNFWNVWIHFWHLVVGLFGRGISPTQGLYLHTGQHNTEKRGHTSMPRVGLEPTIPVFERSKAVRALDCAAIGTGFFQKVFFRNSEIFYSLFTKNKRLSHQNTQCNKKKKKQTEPQRLFHTKLLNHVATWSYTHQLRSVASCWLLRGLLTQQSKHCTRAVCKVRGLAAVRRCYAQGGGEIYARL
jgi:hypothetical protein